MDDMPDNCNPVHFVSERESRAICTIRTVLPHQEEKFALRLLLGHFPARHWTDLLFQNGRHFESFHDAARDAGLVGDVNREAQISMDEARVMNRSPSELRFLLVLLVRDGADLKSLVDEFLVGIREDGDTRANVLAKIARVKASFADVYVYADELAAGGEPVGPEVMPALNEEQEAVCAQIVQAVRDETSPLMFLRGTAGIGKTFTVRRLIQMLDEEGKRCLICATTRIAAVQYPVGAGCIHSSKWELTRSTAGPLCRR
jgi:hypothetical protein